jgi:hypothetical protein
MHISCTHTQFQPVAATVIFKQHRHPFVAATAFVSLPLQDLTCSGQLSYLGTSWRKDVAFAGYGVPLQVRLLLLLLLLCCCLW